MFLIKFVVVVVVVIVTIFLCLTVCSLEQVTLVFSSLRVLMLKPVKPTLDMLNTFFTFYHT